MKHTGNGQRRIRAYLGLHRWALLGGGTLLLFSCLVSLVPPLVVGRAVDGLTQGASPSSLLQAALEIVALAVLSGLFNYGSRQLLVGVSRDIEYELRRDFFAHLLRQPLSYYHERRVGDLISLATNDLSSVRMMTGPAIMQALNTAFQFIGNLVVMLHLSPRLTLVALCALPLTSLSAKFFGQHIHQRFEAVQQEFATLSSRIQETLSGIRVVRAYQQEAAEMTAFDAQNDHLLERNRSIIGLQALFQPLLASLTAVGAALVLWEGGLEVIRGVLTIGTLVQFNLYVARLSWPMRALGWVINQFQRAAASVVRMEREFTVEPAIDDGPGVAASPLGTIRLSDVSVSLPARPDVLDHVTLQVQAGETVGLVGPTGCGKTTLLHTIPRLLEASAGHVEVDGVDVRLYLLADLRGRVGYVTQDSFLFSRTLAENIAFDTPGADAEAALRVALEAGLEADLREFPAGLETMVGERGVTLSGGQKQRVSLARALLRDPHILLLDDAFSAVDSHTEALILEALTTARRGRTTVVVSHRLAAVRLAHRIAVMQNGCIIAVAPHDELLRTCPLYQDLWDRQALAAALEEAG